MVRAVLLKGADRSLILAAFFLLIVFSLMLLLHYEVMPSFKEKIFDLAKQERGIDVRAQIRAGSGDLLGSSLGDYWLRFNFLFFFLPIGLWLAFRKRDMLSWALLLAGFLASLAADRGTRPLTFGFVVMGAQAFALWDRRYCWLLAGWMGFIIGQFGGMYSTEYAVFFPAAAIIIFLGLQWSADPPRRRRGMVILALTLVWVAVGGYLGWRVDAAKDLLVVGGEGALEAKGIIAAIQNHWNIPLCMLAALLLMAWAVPFPRNGGRKERSFLSILLATGLAALSLLALFLIRSRSVIPEGAGTPTWLCLALPAVFAGAVALANRRREGGPGDVRHYWVVGAVCWVFATVIPSMNQTPKSTQAEYDLYRWMALNLEPRGKVLVPWSDGYMAEAISGIPSELSPENIDFELPQVYWLPEEAAADYLQARGISYIVISDRFFQVLAVNRSSGEYRFRFSPDIVYQPQQLGLNTLEKIRPAMLFRLLYETAGLRRFQPLYKTTDASSPDKFMVFQVVEKDQL